MWLNIKSCNEPIHFVLFVLPFVTLYFALKEKFYYMIIIVSYILIIWVYTFLTDMQQTKLGFMTEAATDIYLNTAFHFYFSRHELRESE